MGLRFLKIAVVYLFVGALLGGFMGMTQQFTFAPVHAHLLLLGWASFALAGVVYHLYPARPQRCWLASISGFTTSACRCSWLGLERCLPAKKPPSQLLESRRVS